MNVHSNVHVTFIGTNKFKIFYIQGYLNSQMDEYYKHFDENHTYFNYSPPQIVSPLQSLRHHPTTNEPRILPHPLAVTSPNAIKELSDQLAAPSISTTKKRALKQTKASKKVKSKDAYKDNDKYTLQDWDNVLELFTNGDYGRAHDTTKTTYLVGAFWDKVSTFMGRSNGINVKKAFMRGPQAWVTEYNHVVGEGNTGSNNNKY